MPVLKLVRVGLQTNKLSLETFLEHLGGGGDRRDVCKAIFFDDVGVLFPLGPLCWNYIE